MGRREGFATLAGSNVDGCRQEQVLGASCPRCVRAGGRSERYPRHGSVPPNAGRVGRGINGVRGLLRTGYPDLFGALCLITRDRHEAEEIAQDTFVRVWERWGRVSAMAAPRATCTGRR